MLSHGHRNSLFSSECSVTALLRDRVTAGRFAGGDRRVSFDGRPARRGQPFVALWVISPDVSSPHFLGAGTGPNFAGELRSYWSALLASEFEIPRGPLPRGVLLACLLDSPDDRCAAVHLLTPAAARPRRPLELGFDGRAEFVPGPVAEALDVDEYCDLDVGLGYVSEDSLGSPQAGGFRAFGELRGGDELALSDEEWILAVAFFFFQDHVLRFTATSGEFACNVALREFGAAPELPPPPVAPPSLLSGLHPEVRREVVPDALLWLADAAACDAA